MVQRSPVKMNNQHQKRVLDSFTYRLKIARAVELASFGALENAENLIMNKGLGPQTPEENDILARIYVLQGRFYDARKIWSSALKLEPQNKSFRNALDSLEKILHDLKNRRKVTFLAVNIGLIIIATTLLKLLIK